MVKFRELLWRMLACFLFVAGGSSSCLSLMQVLDAVTWKHVDLLLISLAVLGFGLLLAELAKETEG